MENLFYSNEREIHFIRIIFYMLLAFTGLTLILLIVLPVNDAVVFKQGEIYSSNPQTKISNPTEATVRKVFVTEGQNVQKGDTLMILDNRKTIADYNSANFDINTIKKRIGILNDLLTNARNRKNVLEELQGIQEKIYRTDKGKTIRDIQSINKKITLTDQQYRMVNERFNADSFLYANGAISKDEVLESKNKNLGFTKERIDNSALLSEKRYDYASLTGNYDKSKNSINMGIIDAENQIQNLQSDIFSLQSELQNKQYNLNYLADEVRKLFITAPMDGTVLNLYNSKQNVDQLSKGQILAIIAPAKEEFYAKITMAENDLINVKPKQQVNLKVDAYYYYKYGIIKGVVEYVSASDVDKNFYALVKLNSYNKNIRLKAGYTLKGEIVIERMRLISYIMKKLFKTFDDRVN